MGFELLESQGDKALTTPGRVTRDKGPSRGVEVGAEDALGAGDVLPAPRATTESAESRPIVQLGLGRREHPTYKGCTQTIKAARSECVNPRLLPKQSSGKCQIPVSSVVATALS